MRKIFLNITFLFVSVLLTQQNSFAQSKQGKQVIQPNFVNPFGQKQKPNNNSTQVITPNGLAQTKINQENYTIEKEGCYSFIKFTTNSRIAVREFFQAITKDLNISDVDKFDLIKSENDDIGFTHYRYQQIYNGIPVMGSEFMLHEKSGKLVSANGNYYDSLIIGTIPSITKEKAIDIAIKYVGAEKYQWENTEEEKFLKRETNNPNATHYPVAELLIAPKNGIFKNENFRLCYKINIASEKPYDIVDVYVDAHSGEVVNKIGKIAHADVPSTANTLYSGSKAITADSYIGSFRLRESGRPIQTFNMKNGINYFSAVDFTNSSTTWNTAEVVLNSVTISSVNTNWEDFFEQTSLGGKPDIYIQIVDASSNVIWSKTNSYFENTFPPVIINTGGILLSNGPYTLNIYDYDASSSDDLLGSFTFNAVAGIGTFSAGGTSGSISRTSRNNPALDVHWAMEKTYDFYLTQLGRNSFDNAGGIIKNYVHKDIGWDNANWNGTAMSYGDGSATFSPFVGLDVVGHEFSHAVVQHTASLIYQGESGALNESFADIMGTAIEFYGATAPNWTMGENCTIVTPFYLRSMFNPNSGLNHQPDTYNGTYWANTAIITEANDWGGVHTNSGVQNFWFYLLSQGGSGVNDISHSFSVTGIGITPATKIAYRNLAYYLGTNSNYMNSYYGSLQAAEDLYGATSTQKNAVRSAWYAVGIGNNPSGQCSGTTTYAASSGTFTDGSGSINYENNLDCFWLIQPTGANTITLNFSSFATEANYDTVIVYDGNSTSAPVLMRWWGATLPPAITSSNGALLVRFRTDNNTTNAGWSANYTSSGTAYCNGGTLLTSPSGSFDDGSGTNNYGNNELCYWLIAPPCAGHITLSFSAFNTELSYDGVIVYDGNSTGAPVLLNTSGTSLPSSITSSGGEMLVVFVSDYSTRMQGFAAAYTSTGTPYCSGTTILNTTDWGNVSDGSGTNNYCNNNDCRYLIQPPQATSVTFHFTDFDVEPISTDGFTVYDAVEVYDGTSTSAPLLGRFSGNSLPPSVTSSGGSLYIRFFSDISVTKAGWAGYYTSTTPNYCSGTTTLTMPSGSFSDGSGAYLYGNGEDCKWLIQPLGATSVSLTFTSFETELNYDGIIIYDGSTTSATQIGSYTGTAIPPVVTSTGGSMLVRFISDESVRKNGWNANYTSTIPCNPPSLLTPTSITYNSATVNWSAPSSGGTVNNYTLQYRIQGGSTWTTITTPTSATTYNISSLNPSTNYEYQIRTNCTGTGTSSFTGIGLFTTSAAPCNPPSPLTPTSITYNSATINWSAPTGSTANNYTIEYRIQGSPTWTNTLTTPSSATVYNITGLAASTTYQYHIRTNCASSGVSAFNVVNTFTTLALPCIVPNSLFISNLTSTVVTLNWAISSNATGYNIRYRALNSSFWVDTFSTNATIDIYGLTEGATYEFQVQAVCGGTSSSAFSNSIQFTTTCPNPTDLLTSDVSAYSANIGWGEIAGAQGYNVQYRKAGDTTWSIPVKTTTTSITISNLIPLTSYDYQVQSICTDSTTSSFIDSTFATITSESIVDIYPNPSNGVFTLKFTNITNPSIAIYNTLGASVFKSSVDNIKPIDIETIDLSDMASGFYLVKVSSLDFSKVVKIVLAK